MYDELKLLIQRIGIAFWWLFIVNKNMYHDSLKGTNKTYDVKKQIAYLLDETDGLGYSIWDLPPCLVKRFYKE